MSVVDEMRKDIRTEESPCSSVGPAEAEEPVVWPKPDAWWTGSGQTWQRRLLCTCVSERIRSHACSSLARAGPPAAPRPAPGPAGATAVGQFNAENDCECWERRGSTSPRQLTGGRSSGERPQDNFQED
jgi:hypothetical protein